MRLNGHLYLVRSANGHSTARRLDKLAERAPQLNADELIVSAPDEDHALKIAKVVQQANVARKLVTERGDAFREGYRHALGELRIHIAKIRNLQGERPSGQFPGVHEGRLDLLDTIERWSLSVAPTEPPEPKR